MEGGGYADTKETIYLFPMDRRWIVMKIKFSLFNFEYDNNEKDSKKVHKKSSTIYAIIETFFITLAVSLIIKLVFGL